MNDRELDAQVANHFFSYQVPGIAPCWQDECGDWWLDTHPKLGDREQQPVYLDVCHCDIREETDIVDLHGHYWACFEVVPFYSTDPAACALVKAELRRRECSWFVRYLAPPQIYQCEIQGKDLVGLQEADTEERAVCLAVLDAIGEEISD